jgi:hypothetical protein
MSTKESAEFNAEPTKFTTSTLENAIAPKASTLFKVFAQNASLERPMMNTKGNAASFHAKVSMNSTHLPPKLAFACLNTSVLRVFAPTAHLDTIMTVTATDAFANLDSSKKEVSATLSAPVTKPTSTENASATTEFLSIRVNALFPLSALSTVVLTLPLTAASVTLDSQLLAEGAPATNIVVLMVTSNMVSATATLDSSGSMVPADLAEPTKVSTESHVNATSDSLLMLAETASFLTSNQPAIKMNDMTQPSRLASAFQEPSTLEENASLSPPAQPMPTTTVSNASAILASNYKTDSVWQSTEFFLLAPPTLSSTEFHALATLDSTNLQLTLALPALQEPHGTETPAEPKVPEPALLDTFST